MGKVWWVLKRKGRYFETVKPGEAGLIKTGCPVLFKTKKEATGLMEARYTYFSEIWVPVRVRLEVAE